MEDDYKSWTHVPKLPNVSAYCDRLTMSCLILDKSYGFKVNFVELS